MKVLEIKNNKGYYVIKDNKYEIIDIDKDKIFELLNIIYECTEKIEMDEENNQNTILNEAEKVIYKGIYDCFNDFIREKANLKKEIDDEFSEIIELLEQSPSDDDSKIS